MDSKAPALKARFNFSTRLDLSTRLIRAFSACLHGDLHSWGVAPGWLKTAPLALTDCTMSEGPHYLIVDGHSVIFAWPDLRKLHARSSSLAREALVKQLRDYQDWTGVRVVVVFDGKGKKVSETTDPGDLLLCFLDRSCGIAEPHAAGHALGNAALRRDHAAIGDFDVANDANLACHGDALADARAARDSSLCHDHRIFPDDHVVRNLHEIVDLHALLNPRPAKTRAIDRSVRADLSIIVDLNNPELLNFFVSSFNHFKSETIGANHCATVNDYARANAASLADGYSRINETSGSDHCLMSDVTSRANDRVIADSRPGFDDCVRLDRDTSSQVSAWLHNR